MTGFRNHRGMGMANQTSPYVTFHFTHLGVQVIVDNGQSMLLHSKAASA